MFCISANIDHCDQNHIFIFKFYNYVNSTKKNILGLIHSQIILPIVFWLVHVVFGKLQKGSNALLGELWLPFYYPTMHIILVQCLLNGGLMKTLANACRFLNVTLGFFVTSWTIMCFALGVFLLDTPTVVLYCFHLYSTLKVLHGYNYCSLKWKMLRIWYSAYYVRSCCSATYTHGKVLSCSSHRHKKVWNTWTMVQ